MKYDIYLFCNGECSMKKVREATSHLKALKLSQTYWKWTHALVVGKTSVRRYDHKYRPIKVLPTLFKTWKGKKFSILAMFGRIAEIYPYATGEERDTILEEVKACIESQSVASVKVSPEPTDITVSSSETSDSRNGLMSKKISNGYAMNVIWQARLIRTSIGKYFGTDNADVSVEPEWSRGYTASRSKPQQNILATVKDMTGKRHPIFVTTFMERLAGKTIWVTATDDPEKFIGEGWTWHKSYLDFRKTYAKVHKSGNADGWYSVSSIEELEGLVLRVAPCEDHYNYHGTCIPNKWLIPASKSVDGDKVEAIVLDKVGKMAGTPDGSIIFAKEMARYVGKKLVFEKFGNVFKHDGYKFHKTWLLLEDEWENSGKRQNEKSRHSWVERAYLSLDEHEAQVPTSSTNDIVSKSSTGKASLSGSLTLLRKLTRLEKKIAKLPLSHS